MQLIDLISLFVELFYHSDQEQQEAGCRNSPCPHWLSLPGGSSLLSSVAFTCSKRVLAAPAVLHEIRNIVVRCQSAHPHLVHCDLHNVGATPAQPVVCTEIIVVFQTNTEHQAWVENISGWNSCIVCLSNVSHWVLELAVMKHQTIIQEIVGVSN